MIIVWRYFLKLKLVSYPWLRKKPSKRFWLKKTRSLALHYFWTNQRLEFFKKCSINSVKVCYLWSCKLIQWTLLNFRLTLISIFYEYTRTAINSQLNFNSKKQFLAIPNRWNFNYANCVTNLCETSSRVIDFFVLLFLPIQELTHSL